MRAQFSSFTRPKAMALRIQTVFPALSHMRALEWAARILGYRDWHELAKSTPPNVTETPDVVLEDNEGRFVSNEQSREFFKRELAQRRILEELIGHPIPEIESLYFHISSNVPSARYRKLGKSGTGTPCFKGLGWSLYEHDGEEPGLDGGVCLDITGPREVNAHIYKGVPEEFTEITVLNALLAHMRRCHLPYNGFIDVTRECLEAGPYGQTSFDTEVIDQPGDEVSVAWQGRRARYFVIHNGQPIGFAVTEVTASVASNHQNLSLEVEICEAWWPSSSQLLILEALASAITLDVSAPLKRLVWFRVSNPEVRIHVEIMTESESERAAELAAALVQTIPPDFECFSPPGVLENVSFSVDICP